MPFKVNEPDVDGISSCFIEEFHQGEVGQLFLDADQEAESMVEILFEIEPITEEDIILYREDWTESIQIARKQNENT